MSDVFLPAAVKSVGLHFMLLHSANCPFAMHYKSCPTMSTYSIGFCFFCYFFHLAWQMIAVIMPAFCWVPFLSKHPVPSHNQTLSPVSISCTRQSPPSSPACLCVFLLSPSGLMSCSDITTNSMKAGCAATQSHLHSAWSVRHSLKHTSHLFPRTVPNQLVWG